MATILKIEGLRYVVMMQNGSFKQISHPPSWIFETEI